MSMSKDYLPILTCLILIHFIQTPSCAKQHSKSSSCNPSACGNILSISYPFRLKDDPEYCGHHNRSYEISCENNTTASVYLDNHKYHVRAINYNNYTIRLADPSIKNDDSCSFPTFSPNWTELVYNKYSSVYRVSVNEYYRGALERPGMVCPVTFLSCPFPLNDPLFVETNRCVSFSSNTSITQRHIYIKAGGLNPRDIKNMCRIDLVVMTSLPFIYNDISVLKIHESLLYGFELSWSVAFCDFKPWEDCWFDGIMRATCVSRVGCNYSYHMIGEDLSYRIISRYPLRDSGICRYDSPKPRYYDTLVRLLVILVYSTDT